MVIDQHKKRSMPFLDRTQFSIIKPNLGEIFISIVHFMHILTFSTIKYCLILSIYNFAFELQTHDLRTSDLLLPCYSMPFYITYDTILHKIVNLQSDCNQICNLCLSQLLAITSFLFLARISQDFSFNASLAPVSLTLLLLMETLLTKTKLCSTFSFLQLPSIKQVQVSLWIHKYPPAKHGLIHTFM